MPLHSISNLRSLNSKPHTVEGLGFPTLRDNFKGRYRGYLGLYRVNKGFALRVQGLGA